MTDLVASQTAVAAPNIFDLGPSQMLTHATAVADVLKDVIRKQRLTSNIQGKDYVRVEGWATLGSILGILPREVSVTELPDGSYEAVVELYSVKTGKVVGQGSALCGIDEKRWGNAERFARRSMAITRATGKAYRLGLSWIMSLAGYETTPAEEMIDIPFAPTPAAKVKSPTKPGKGSIYEGTEEQNEIISRILTTKNVPAEKWEVIQEKLMGRPSTDLNNVIREVANA